MHQPYRTFTAAINRYISGKSTDTPDVSVSKKKASATTDRSKGTNLLSEAALLEDSQMKKVLKQSKKETHSRQASGSGDGVGSQPMINLRVKRVLGESGDDDSNDDDNNDDSNNDDSDDDGNNDASDDEGAKSYDDQNDNDKEEEYKDEFVHTPSSYESTDDENKHVDEEEYDRLNEGFYNDMSVKLNNLEHEEEGKGEVEKTDVGHDDVTQETTYDQVEDDVHVTLITVYDTQKTKVPLQSSSVSSDFATQFLNLDNVSTADTKINSIMNIDVRHEEPSIQTPSLLTILVSVIPKTLIVAATIIPPPIPPFTPLPQLSIPTSIPTPTPTTEATTSFPAIPDFSSLFRFNQRVSVLEKELSQLKQVDHSKQLFEAMKSQVPAVVEAHRGTRLRVFIQKAFQLYTAKFKKKAQAEKKRKSIDFRPPQTWISKIAQAEKPLLSFNELMSTPIDFFAYVINNLKINNLTQEHLVGPAFNLLKGTRRNRVKLEYPIIDMLFEEFLMGVLNDDDSMDSQAIRDVIFDLGVELQMFTRRIVILKRVEDLQLRVESYQKKLNIKKPETYRSDISNRTLYTTYNNPKGIIYKDKYKRNMLMRTDKLYKFSNGTLAFGRSVLYDTASNLRMDYLPKRSWSSLDRKTSHIMIKAINKQHLERRLIRSLKKFVGGKDYEEDLRLLQRNI
nr:hypothetical protein [Tanacetum cinerariifolium]